jgi:hypothetical protein
MRRIVLSCALVAAFTLPAAASARAQAQPGYLVVRKASGDGGVNGHAVVTVVVKGFVLGRVSQEAHVEIYQLPSPTGEGAPQAKGADVSAKPVRWHGLPGKQYSGSGFRFSAIGGYYRVVVRGSGIYLFAGGRGQVWLQGSSFNRGADGTYSADGRAPRSLPTRMLNRKLGRR